MHRAARHPGRWIARLAGVLLHGLLAFALAVGPVAALEPEFGSFDVVSNEEGVLLSYAVDFELSRSVDDALTKAVPLFFVAQAEVFRSRWYWRDLRVAEAVRVWKVVYQPLTANYR